MTKPRIVVLGAGFAGVQFCKRIDTDAYDVTLVDRQNHHLFQPLLYQVAASGLAVPDIAQPIRMVLSNREITILMDEALEIDLDAKRVKLREQTLEYDYLVIGLGAVTGYFGHPEWAEHAPGLKSIKDATRIRQDVLHAFEQAENCPSPEEVEKLLTIIVIGGGPTGVELAGAFAELARFTLARDFRRIDPTKARVVLVEAADRILAHLPPQLSESAKRQLASLGVEVRLNSMVKDLRHHEVVLEDETLRGANIFWTAGVAAHPITRQLGVELDRAGRIRVLPDLSLPGRPEVFALGDIVSLVDANGRPVPGVSPAAIQMANFAAKLLGGPQRDQPPESRPKFAYWDKGTMATIGRRRAVAQIGKLRMSGYPAWLAWLFVHLIFLVGFRSKISVLAQWTYSYFTYRRGARIIHSAEDVTRTPKAEAPRGP